MILPEIGDGDDLYDVMYNLQDIAEAKRMMRESLYLYQRSMTTVIQLFDKDAEKKALRDLEEAGGKIVDGFQYMFDLLDAGLSVHQNAIFFKAFPHEEGEE